MTTSPASPRRTGTSVHTGRILQTVFSVAILLATLFVFFSPKMFSGNISSLISGLLAPNIESGPAATTRVRNTVRIGIVSGHWGNGDDPGAVCADGTNEHDVNLKIASLARQKLEAYGYNVDLLQEFDSRLEDYNAAVLLSIHADTCDVIDDQATGFKLTTSTYSHDQNSADRLKACLIDRYSSTTGLKLHAGSVTLDMTNYHAFSVIDPATTAAIIETGFLNLDHDLLVNHPDVVADGLVKGIQCFVNNESVQAVTQPTP
jgi:N-acetylmuramoyl-L-alanine amidase